MANFVLRPYTDEAEVDWERLDEVVSDAVHFLDNVIDANKYPLEKIAEKALADRRIGLGVMGWAEMLVQLGLAYDSQAACDMGRRVMSRIKQAALQASMALAEQRGVYPEWEGSEWAKQGVRVRHATLTTVAPTGTISIFAGQSEFWAHELSDPNEPATKTRYGMPCSGGIEPKFALVFTRRQAGMQMLDVDKQFEYLARREGWYSEKLMAQVAERGTVRGVDGVPEKWQRVFATSHDIAPEWHVRMQAAFQGEDHLSVVDQPVCAAVSKTVNFPKEATVEDVNSVYRLAWELGLKGVTVYRDGSRQGQVLSTGKSEAKAKEEVTAPSKEPTGPILRPRLTEAAARMYVVETHFGKMTLNVHLDENGEPFEVIVNVGATGSDLMADAVALGMMISTLLRLRSDVPISQRLAIVIGKLKGIGGSGSFGFGPNRVTSLASAIAKALQQFVAWQDAQKGTLDPAFVELVRVDESGELCPDCGNATLRQTEGCKACHNCGYSAC